MRGSWLPIGVLLQRPKRGIEAFPRLPDRAAHEASGTAPPTSFTPYDHPVGVFASLFSAHGGLYVRRRATVLEKGTKNLRGGWGLSWKGCLM